MVSIGLIIEKTTNYEYVINMITAQEYDFIEIICSLDEDIELSPYDILEFIRVHTKDNIRRVYMVRNRSKSYEEHIKSILKVSCGDYLFIHSSKDWLYDPNVIKSLCEEITENEEIIAGSCVLYEEGQYIGQTYFSKEDEDDENVCLSIEGAVKTGLPLLINRSFLQEKCDIKMELDLETVKLKVTDVPSLCHETLVQVDEEKKNIEEESIQNQFQELDNTKISWWRRIFSNKNVEQEKIKVAFIVQMLEVWDKQSPVFEEMNKNPLIDVSIILVPAMDLVTHEFKTYTDEIDFMKRRYPKANLIKAIDSEGKVLKIENKQFDYIFYPRPYDNYLPEALKSSNVFLDTKVCYIPYGYQGANVFMEGNTNDEFFRNVYMSFLESEEIKDVLERKFEASVKTNTQKFLSLGYPIFDTYLNLKESLWNRRKRCILWTPRWAFDPQQGGSHFVDYMRTFVELRKDYPKKKLMIRPHPLMWENVVKEGLLTFEEIDEYKNLLQNKKIQIDTNKMLEDTIKKSGVLITDFSSIIITYFMTGKPIIYCPFETELNELFQKLLPGMYVANSWDEVKEYVDMIERGKDVLYSVRQEIIENELKHLGGGTKRIVDAIIEDFNEC